MWEACRGSWLPGRLCSGDGLWLFPRLLAEGHGRGLRREPAGAVPRAGAEARGTRRLELLRSDFVHVDRRAFRVPALGAEPGAGARGETPGAGGAVQRLLPCAAQDPGLYRAVSGDRPRAKGVPPKGRPAPPPPAPPPPPVEGAVPRRGSRADSPKGGRALARR